MTYFLQENTLKRRWFSVGSPLHINLLKTSTIIQIIYDNVLYGHKDEVQTIPICLCTLLVLKFTRKKNGALL